MSKSTNNNEDTKIPGTHAIELLKELSRSDQISEFDENTRQKIISEIEELYAQVIHIGDIYEQTEDPKCIPALLLFHNGIVQNKRCYMTYLVERLGRIRKLRWDVGNVLPQVQTEKLGEYEKQYFDGYNEILTDYMAEFNGLELTNNLTAPPQKLNIEVKVLKDYGIFLLEDGASITLRKGNRLFLPQSEIEGLIKQRVVEHV